MQNTATGPNIPALNPDSFIPENDDDLINEITRLAGNINAAQYRFLKLLAALIERGVWGCGTGFKSPAHWLNYYCGYAYGAAREKVRVAKCLGSLPLIQEAFATGAISYSKVRAMTRSATAENEGFLLMIAEHGTAQHMESLLRNHQRVERLCEKDQSKAQHKAREFSWYYDDDGMFVFEGRLPAEEGAMFLKAMDAVLQKPKEAQASDSSQPVEIGDQDYDQGEAESVPAETEILKLPKKTLDSKSQKRADALVFMSEHLLSTLGQSSPLSGSDKFQVMIHIEAGSANDVGPLNKQSLNPSDCGKLSGNLSRNHSDGHSVQCHLDNGSYLSPLSSATTRRLACDASLIPVLEDPNGEVLNVGRKTRTVPPAIRRALQLRDHGCRFPGCCESRFVDAHHIHHWCDGGVTSLNNLLLLCRRHHRLLHDGVFTVTAVAAGATSPELVFTNAAGKKMEQSLFPQFKPLKSVVSKLVSAEPAKSLAIEADNRALDLDINCDTAITAWHGESMDYGLAVDSLIRRS